MRKSNVQVDDHKARGAVESTGNRRAQSRGHETSLGMLALQRKGALIHSSDERQLAEEREKLSQKETCTERHFWGHYSSLVECKDGR